MRLGIVCSFAGNLGHAAVARALVQRARWQRAVERVVVLCDQVDLFAGWPFFPPNTEILAIGKEALPELDVLVWDGMPFRRMDAFHTLLGQLGSTKPRMVIGHTGWVATLPDVSRQVLESWRRALDLLESRTVLVYHSQEVCAGACDIANLARPLGLSVVHSGLLLPTPALPSAAREKTFLAISGGGAQASPIMDRAAQFLDQLPDWRCDVILGPFADHVAAGNARQRVIRGVTDVASRLRQYQFSITRSGYSACCEHIAAGIPTLLLPLEYRGPCGVEVHAEQGANMLWATPYLRSVSIDRSGRVAFGTHLRPPPSPFGWAHLEAAL